MAVVIEEEFAVIDNKHVEPWIDFTAGAVGGVCQLITGHPLDTIKVTLQTSNGEFSGIGDVFRHILKNDGFGGLYKGVASPFFGFTALNAVIFTSYGMGNRMFRGSIPQNELLPLDRIFLSGCFTGVTTAFVESPMDLFKAKMQSQKPNAQGKLEYKSTFDCISKILQTNKIRGAYQGFHATLFRNVPANACYFVGYEWAKRILSNDPKNPSPITVLFAGGFAGFCFWSLCYPLDVLKTIVQTDANNISERKYKSYLDCIKRTYANGGAKRFYAGYLPCILRSFPANGACFCGYEFTKKLLSGK